MSYQVRFVDYPEHYRRIWDETLASITDCLSNGDLIMRQQVEDFEANLASFVGVNHAVSLNSGTDALFLSLKAAGIKPGDEVITVSHTFVATIAAIHYCGAKPVLIDVNEDMNMDVSQLEKVINSRTKAIIPVHLNGRICDMKPLMMIAEKYNLAVIEDSAQSLGATYYGKMAGSMGLTGCFSFYPAKILGCAGDGGALVTNNSNIAEMARLLRDHGYVRATGEILMYGYNSRLDNIQAAILNVKMKYLPQWIERRRKIAGMYQKGLEDISDIIRPPYEKNDKVHYDAFQNYVIRSKKRDNLAKYLRESGVEILISWPVPTHHHKNLGLSSFKLPKTEELSRTVISLPMFPEISNESIMNIIEIIHNYSW
jgi:dTDP-4-amino-4,6-dideoxygalactose transaminase